jgi:hypothetical protein
MYSDTLRTSTLPELIRTLEDQHKRARDVVASAAKVSAYGSDLIVAEMGEPVLTSEGVTPTDQQFGLTPVAVEGLAKSLGIPTPYAAKMHAQRPDLFMLNANGWLHGGPDIEGDKRKFLIRTLADPTGLGLPTIRAWLSDKFRTIDNLDVAMAALDGIRSSDSIDPSRLVITADLTETRMYIRVRVPDIEVQARELLRNYRGPDGTFGRDNPSVYAGMALTNSEVGKGAFNLVPWMMERVCKNGLVVPKDAIRRIHMGTQLDEGVIEWSKATLDANLALITTQTRDAVKTFLSQEYLERKVAELTEAAGHPVTDAEGTVQRVSKAVGFTKAQATDILGSFISGADLTSGGVMQAITAVAQTYDADTQYAMELQAVRAMELAAGRH